MLPNTAVLHMHAKAALHLLHTVRWARVHSCFGGIRAALPYENFFSAAARSSPGL